MKLLILLLLLSACGKETAYVIYGTKGDRGDIGLQGTQGPAGRDADETRIELLEERIALLETQVDANTNNIETLSNYLDSLLIELRLQQIDETLSLLSQTTVNLDASVTALDLKYETIVNGLESQIADLEANQYQIVKPCSNSKEVLIKTPTGYVAYFQSGNPTQYAYLTILLENVNYQTTDNVNCKFKIVSGNIIKL